jgi:hypothetical protein
VVIDESNNDLIQTLWIATTSEEAPRLLIDLIELARQRGAKEMAIKMPNIPWVMEALSRSGGDPREVVVYSLAV